MIQDLQHSMIISSTSEPVAANLSSIFMAEQQIASMPPEASVQLDARISNEPENGFLRLWKGLVLLNQKKFDVAIAAFFKAIDLGCNHWRIAWYIATAASKKHDLSLVDSACAAVLSAKPDFWFARELPKHARGYYAQLDQDKFIEKFFREQHPRSKTFVEVGAFDGVHYSNVRRLAERYGWTGICVEPVQKNYQKLVESYRGLGVDCVRAAAGNEEKISWINVSTYPHLPQWGSDVASLSDREMDRWTKLYGARWEKEQVSVKRLTTILDECNVTDFDLLSVDAEEFGLEVLLGLDFERFQPQLICIEYGQQRNSIVSFLSNFGYSVCLDNAQDLFMARINHDLYRRDSLNNLPETVNFTGISGVAPYLEIQKEAELNIHTHVGKSPADIRCIVIVGGYLGHEVGPLLKNYPNAEIHIFEPSRRYYGQLAERFGANFRVKCYNCAVGNRNGTETFYEGSLEGIGSLLPLKTREGLNSWIPTNAKPAESYSVKTVTLDHVDSLQDKTIDMLWCDVQGAELKVLQGAQDHLRRCRALFLEVALSKETYHGQCLLSGLRQYLSGRGFFMAGIGLCQTGNGTGNSLWLQADAGVSKSPATGLAKVDRPGIKDRLNPHMLSCIPIDRAVEITKLPSSHLLNPRRFDLMAKIIYAKLKDTGINSDWGRKLYLEHIRVLNGFSEGDGSGKTSPETFIDAFDAVIDSIRDKGFSDRISLVPIDRNNVIIDGAHRVAACFAHNCEVVCLRFDIEANDYSSYFFKTRSEAIPGNLPSTICDAMALEYCKLNRNTYIVSVFPSAVGNEEFLNQILLDSGSIVYEKQINLNRIGSFNLIRQMYAGEPWVGDHTMQFAGAYTKAEACFREKGPLRIYVLEAVTPLEVKKAKDKIRRLFNIANDSVHINDHHAETIRLAQILFNDNSLHFLNHAKPVFFDRFYQMLSTYKNWLERHGCIGDHFCIDGSAVMSAYGLREPHDLDYLHHGYDDLSSDSPLIASHNLHANHHDTSIDDIIFNPDNHLYFDGVKFTSLHLIREMKKRRSEEKDTKDVSLIDPLLKAHNVMKTGQGPGKPKIIGLIAARNEANVIEMCLRGLSLYTDAIVFLDDASDDETLNIVNALASECRVEKIIAKEYWHRNEPEDRNTLLKAGRKIGGTHFVVIDADEMFTSNCSTNDLLRNEILSLRAGDKLVMTWIQLWRGFHQYRYDDSIWTHNRKAVIFGDDGKCQYGSDFIHTARVPDNLAGEKRIIPGYQFGLLHFQFVNWQNLLLKQGWYRCLERLRKPDKSIAAINKRYAASKDENNLGLKPALPEWFEAYDFFKPGGYLLPDSWRKRQVCDWFHKYGREAFAELDIWDIDWGDELEEKKRA